MIRRPPRTTRTDTLVPYTTLFRSHRPAGKICQNYGKDVDNPNRSPKRQQQIRNEWQRHQSRENAIQEQFLITIGSRYHEPSQGAGAAVKSLFGLYLSRSEERRGGKECVSTCRLRGWPAYKKKKKNK